MGHFLIPALNPRDMEADILDYMRGRYAAEGLDALVALLDVREAEREADTPLVPFRTWLLRLPEAGIDMAALERFITDLVLFYIELNAPLAVLELDKSGFIKSLYGK